MSNQIKNICFSCKSPNELAPGCAAVSSIDSNNLHMTLDPERDLQRLHSLVIAHISRLEALIKVCDCEAVYSGSMGRLPVIEDVQSCLNMMLQLRDVVYQLEKQHRTYQRSLARDTKYGSK